jgi:short-subunit dehydrogenase
MSFVDKYGPWGVVLGASEGLGQAYAEGMAKRGLSVVVAARRPGPLRRVATDVAQRYDVETRWVQVDLAREDFLDPVRVVTDALDVGLVVYNGASAYVGPILTQEPESLRSIIGVNCHGPLLACHHFGRRLVDKGRGGIVVMGSAAGLAGSAYNSAYAASKAFDIVLGESLWSEWQNDGVDVLSVIGPAIDTPNFRAMSPEVREGLPAPMAPALVVDEVFDALGSTPSFVPGEEVRDMLKTLGTLPRQMQVEALSAAQAPLSKGDPKRYQ